ncbi:MAG: hypothetical protein EBU66_05580 [Bacteroidetes bacterium]|nr:hypothetical protein [bacterium]NBP64133.1 hypothetical protein [Bacteroidota bacterium]
MDALHMRGGRKLAEGGYGCIFDPPLLCHGKMMPKKPNMIGKLTDPGDIASEINATKILKKMPEANNYFILPELDTICQDIRIRDQTESQLGTCDVLLEHGIANLIHYQMKNGGTSLHAKLDSIHIGVTQFPFYNFMRYILEAGAYLALKGVIHNDLHSGNIVVDDKYNFRLIDFGRSYTVNGITEDLIESLSAEYNIKLGQITPESTAQDGKNIGMSLTAIVEDIRQNKPTLKLAEKLFGYNRLEQVNEFKYFWTKSLSVSSGNYVKFWKYYWPAVDAWGIGYILVSTLYKLSLSNKFMKSSEWKQKSPLIKTVITGLLQCSPIKRLDCVEALALYDPMNALVLSSSGKAWLEKKAKRV